MVAPLISSGRSARRLSIAMLASMALLAACDIDETVAPNRAEIPATAQAALSPLKSGTLVVRVVDQFQIVITTSSAQFTGAKAGQAPWALLDNAQGDSDPAVGTIKLSMAPGTYEVCETTAPVDHALPNSKCQTISVVAGTTTNLMFINPTIARLRWTVVDIWQNYVGGAAFSLTDSNATVIATFVDNAPPDVDPTPGKFEVKLPVEGVYGLCTVQPPAGYVYPGQQVFCMGHPVQHGQITTTPPYTVYPTLSAYWQVTDGTMDANFSYNLIGPSKFKVTSAVGAFTMDVIDNGLNDIDAALGKLAVKLPAAGYYSICEIQPPPNHWNAKPSCKRINVQSNVPAWAEWFINPEAQVLYPKP